MAALPLYHVFALTVNFLFMSKIGGYIDLITDYHANGSYESLKENVELLEEKR